MTRDALLKQHRRMRSRGVLLRMCLELLLAVSVLDAVLAWGSGFRDACSARFSARSSGPEMRHDKSPTAGELESKKENITSTRKVDRRGLEVGSAYLFSPSLRPGRTSLAIARTPALGLS